MLSAIVLGVTGLSVVAPLEHLRKPRNPGPIVINVSGAILGA